MSDDQERIEYMAKFHISTEHTPRTYVIGQAATTWPFLCKIPVRGTGYQMSRSCTE